MRRSTASKKRQGPPTSHDPTRLSTGEGLRATCAERTPGASQRQKDPPEAAASGTSLHAQHRGAGLIPGRGTKVGEPRSMAVNKREETAARVSVRPRLTVLGQVRHGRWDSQ